MGSYAPPTVGVAGLQIPSYAAILQELIDQYRSQFGQAVYLGIDSPDYQDLAIRALQTYNAFQALQVLYNASDPGTAIGTSLDKVGRLLGTPRKSATYSSALVTFAGTPGSQVVNGVVRDINGNYWNVASPAVIGSGGTISVIATAQSPGNITAEPGDISIIQNPQVGWTSVTNSASAEAGEAVEPDSLYRARLMISSAKPSLTVLAGTAAAVAAVSGVTRSMVYENPTNSTDGYGNPAHSITCVVEGGALAAIAQAIYDNRGIGCYTNGTTSETVTDPLNPAITMNISFDVLAYTPVYVSINVHQLTGYTTATTAAIAAAIVSYLNSLAIGESVVYSEIYGAALTARPNPDTPLFSIRAVSMGAAVAQTSGSTSTGSPNVTVVSATGIATGQTVTGPGIPAGTTVSGISGTAVTLSANATATASAAALQFFTLGTSDISMAFNYAAQGSSLNVVVNLV